MQITVPVSDLLKFDSGQQCREGAGVVGCGLPPARPQLSVNVIEVFY